MQILSFKIKTSIANSIRLQNLTPIIIREILITVIRILAIKIIG